MWKQGFVVLLLAHLMVAEDRQPTKEEKKQRCKCVPYYQCPKIPDEASYAFARSQCESSLEVCCEVPVVGLPATTEPPPRAPKRICGRRSNGGVGHGDEDNKAQFGEFPWMVAVMKVETHEGEEVSTQALNMYQCGGSLIHPKVVVTGAHCVAGKESHELKIRAGFEETDFQNRYVTRVLVHENFNDGNLFNDVALLFLSKPVIPTENVGFACLPTQGDTPTPGTRCLATVWEQDDIGKKRGNQGFPQTLKKIDLPVVANPDCQTELRKTKLGGHFKLHQSFICAGGEQDKDTCMGDGGSPLVCPLPENPEIYVQSGIVAWGIGCGKEQIPGVYTNVALFRNWVDTKIHEAHLDTIYYSP